MSKSMSSYTFKMILLGEFGSGKTCLFHRIIYNQYRDGGTYYGKGTLKTTPTTGGLGSIHYESHTKEVELPGKIRVNVRKLHIHDVIVVHITSKISEFLFGRCR